MSQGNNSSTDLPIESKASVRTSVLPWDRLGFVASSLCAVHCVCMPWLLLIMPFLAGSWLADPELERGFIVASIVLAMICTTCGCHLHRKWWLMGLLGVGAATLFGAHATAPPACCSQHLSWPNAIGAACGGALLAATHFLNLRLQRTPALAAVNDCCPDPGCSNNVS